MFDYNEPLECLSNWYKRQGLKVVQTESSGWVELSKGVFQAFPYHWQISPSETEIWDIFKEHRILALRFSTPLDQRVGKISYHVVCESKNYHLRPLAKKARHDVAHGLKYASYSSYPIKRLAHEGWKLRSETLDRQGRTGAEDRQFWENLCFSAEENPAFEAWGAVHKGELVAALIACTVMDTVCILYQQSRTAHLKYGINNTLAFTFTQEVMKRSEIKCVFYGLESLDAPPSVDQFKFRMGYSTCLVRQRVVFNPVLRPFLNVTSYQIIKAILRFQPQIYFLAKAEGMLRFYLQGKRPLPEQEWPITLLEK